MQELEQHLRSDSARSLVGQRDLTLGQAVTLAAAQVTGQEFGRLLRRAVVRVLVTPKMSRWPPDLGDLDVATVSVP